MVEKERFRGAIYWSIVVWVGRPREVEVIAWNRGGERGQKVHSDGRAKVGQSANQVLHSLLLHVLFLSLEQSRLEAHLFTFFY